VTVLTYRPYCGKIGVVSKRTAKEHQMSTVTITQSDTPSRSKMAGPCWIRIGSVYASTNPREITSENGKPLLPGDTVTAEGKLNIRRVTRTAVLRKSWKLHVTGNPDDSAELTVTPYGQTVTAIVTGVTLAEES
jgi:hypothetical protein